MNAIKRLHQIWLNLHRQDNRCITCGRQMAGKPSPGVKGKPWCIPCTRQRMKQFCEQKRRAVEARWN